MSVFDRATGRRPHPAEHYGFVILRFRNVKMVKFGKARVNAQVRLFGNVCGRAATRADQPPASAPPPPAGKARVTRVPRPTSLVMWAVPRWRVAMPLTMA